MEKVTSQLKVGHTCGLVRASGKIEIGNAPKAKQTSLQGDLVRPVNGSDHKHNQITSGSIIIIANVQKHLSWYLPI